MLRWARLQRDAELLLRWRSTGSPRESCPSPEGRWGPDLADMSAGRVVLQKPAAGVWYRGKVAVKPLPERGPSREAEPCGERHRIQRCRGDSFAEEALGGTARCAAGWKASWAVKADIALRACRREAVLVCAYSCRRGNPAGWTVQMTGCQRYGRRRPREREKPSPD